MKRNSREKDSKREENSPAERFSEIIFLEPALKAADEKSCRSPALWAYKRTIHQGLFLERALCSVKLGGTANSLRPFYLGRRFFIVNRIKFHGFDGNCRLHFQAGLLFLNSGGICYENK